MTFAEEGQEVMTEFSLKEGVFADRGGNHLMKAAPSPPAVNYLAKYAGSYHMLADGQTATVTSDKYVFTADGKCTWTYFPDGTASAVKKGTWKASDGLIQMDFNTGNSGMKGDELLTDFKLQDGVFWAEGVFLKKAEVKSGTPKK